MLLFMKIHFNSKEEKRNSTILQAPEYKNLATLRLINLVALGGFSLVILGIGIFMYNNIYVAIGQIQSIVVFKTQIGSEAIDFVTLDKVREKWNKKDSDTKIEIKRDPFNPLSITTVSSTPS